MKYEVIVWLIRSFCTLWAHNIAFFYFYFMLDNLTHECKLCIIQSQWKSLLHELLRTCLNKIEYIGHDEIAKYVLVIPQKYKTQTWITNSESNSLIL